MKQSQAHSRSFQGTYGDYPALKYLDKNIEFLPERDLQMARKYLGRINSMMSKIDAIKQVSFKRWCVKHLREEIIQGVQKNVDVPAVRSRILNVLMARTRG